MPRTLLMILALVVGIGIGAAAVVGLDDDDGEPEAGLTPSRVAVDAPPTGPVAVAIETVRLGTGFTSRHRHGGLTVNLVRAGSVEISDARSLPSQMRRSRREISEQSPRCRAC